MRRSSLRPKHVIAPEARYANYFEVGHNAHEFIFDFGQYHPEQAAAQLHMRVVTSPVYAKLLSKMLCEAVERHECEHGAIRTGSDDNQPRANSTANAVATQLD
jgi:Protein of unknown function (DUF3467)